MATIYDIPPDVLINRLGEDLKKRSELKPPEWAPFVKTGVHKEMPPENPDWWYIRAAAILCRIYKDGPVGVQRIRTVYGGKRDRGSRPHRFKKGSGSIVRRILQQLEAAGFVIKGKSGRSISPAGQSYVDGMAFSILKNMSKPSVGLVK